MNKSAGGDSRTSCQRRFYVTSRSGCRRWWCRHCKEHVTKTKQVTLQALQHFKHLSVTKELVARVLKKPDLISAGLATLAAEVGIAWEASKYLPSFNWRALVFSDEQIKYVVEDVYASFLIGTKLLGKL
ncbi:hypothetical protein LOK49_LG13G00296 [Camellia lanceoleosa]|uniref:Uncharacterized protein n=1 Tax=Camellia lanceoleosa TaxID=1840588 RepID=A0ACC0FHY8_9ERIC|nr:hypothetical protein LOK49_LG13G00296 [Camellia lanceoleosa]